MNRHATDSTPAILSCERPTQQSAPRGPGGLLSIVVPCHNEEAVVAAAHERLVAAVATTGMELEIIYIDDGSRDATLEKLEAIAARDRRAVIVELSRNFGQQAAMSAGLAQARGDAVVIIDADLQDPPEVIPDMVRAWRSGVDVAYGRRRSREGETRFKLITASLFHRLFASLMPYPIPVDTGDFKLVDRAVVDAVCSLPEKRRYLRSLVPWAGFRQEPVWYDRHARTTGETNYSARTLLRLAADALVISSDAPVRLTWLASLALGGVGLIAAAGTIWSSLNATAGNAAQGTAQASSVGAGISLAALIAVVATSAAVQTAAVAIVGEYVVRTYRESQGRPTWVVRRTINAAGNVRSSRAA
ncbi:MAG: glycosyltransferase family 2 protein [Planctomycetota bacterium]